MIQVGVTGWGDHDSLYPEKTAAKHKLGIYGKYFSIVELDASFYALQPHRHYHNWIGQTPDHFSFVIKPQQAITGHKKGKTIAQLKDEIKAFRQSLTPVVEAEKLKAVLIQFPPQFSCLPKNVAYLRFLKEQMQDFPCALEFRHQTWFNEIYAHETLAFMKQEGFIHTIVDAPQVGMGSVPTVLEATHPELTLIRFHGRNISGWNPENKDNWRQVRYLYRYKEQELLEWVTNIHVLTQQSQNICLIFNNNSGGDAAPNAKEMMKLLGLKYNEQVSSQLQLF
ncbi:MAG: DUF72 domain-containing protein [Defluviitaleaceae bacterium]|nr:DUF72 domain-containing protein [Defluviitaleaceae bacterium]